MTARKSPKQQWEELIQGYKYLAIRNWDEFQELTPSGDPAKWIKDYTNSDFDEPLSFFVRGVLGSLGRFRGRLGYNLPTDLQLLLSGTAAIRLDRHNVVAALVQLVGSGRLILTNEQDMVSKKRRVEKSKGENNISATKPADAGVQTEKEPQVSVPVQDKEPPSDADRFAGRFYKLVGKPKAHLNSVDEWTRIAQALLQDSNLEELSAIAEFAIKEDSFWAEALMKANDPMASFNKNIEKITQAYLAYKASLDAIARRAGKVKNAGKADKQEYQKDAGSFFAEAVARQEKQ